MFNFIISRLKQIHYKTNENEICSMTRYFAIHQKIFIKVQMLKLHFKPIALV